MSTHVSSKAQRLRAYHCFSSQPLAPFDILSVLIRMAALNCGLKKIWVQSLPHSLKCCFLVHAHFNAHFMHLLEEKTISNQMTIDFCYLLHIEGCSGWTSCAEFLAVSQADSGQAHKNRWSLHHRNCQNLSPLWRCGRTLGVSGCSTQPQSASPITDGPRPQLRCWPHEKRGPRWNNFADLFSKLRLLELAAGKLWNKCQYQANMLINNPSFMPWTPVEYAWLLHFRQAKID